MKSTARVFVSSARGRQLDAYREIVVKVARRFDFEPVFMEEFAPDRTSPADYCRDLVQGCDAVVLLVAHRYGSLVPGEGRSYTELEYDTALAMADLPLYVWIVDEDWPWRPAEIDGGEDCLRLQRFKERLGTHTAGRFSDPAAFHNEIAYALAGLRQQLDAAGAAPRVATTLFQRRLPRPPDMATVPAYVGNLTFTGREEQQAWLDGWAASSDAVAVVEAIGGTGKSALTWEWFTNRGPRVIGGLAGRFWWSFYDSSNTVTKFQQMLFGYLNECPPEEAERLDAVALADAVITALEERPFLVVMDGFERLLNAYHRVDAGTVTDDDVDHLRLTYARAITDPLAHDFVRRLAGLRTSKVLISSRLLPDALVGFGNILLPGVRHFVLPGLRTHETRQLLTRLGIRHAYADLKTFFDRLDNHPLLIGIVAGLVLTYRPSPGDFDAWLADPDHGQRFSVADLPITERSHHILEHALAGLDGPALTLLQGIAVPGGASTWDMLQIINPFLPGDPLRLQGEPLPAYLQQFVDARRVRQRTAELDDPRLALTRLDAALGDLQARGLLWWNTESNSYDLHPVVRAYVSGTTEDTVRKAANEWLSRDHFGRMYRSEDPTTAQSIEDLLITISYFRSLVGCGRLEAAEQLWDDRLSNALVFRLALNLAVVPLLGEFLAVGSARGIEWDLALAERGMGRLDAAVERQLRLLSATVERRDGRVLLPALKNLIVSVGDAGASAARAAYTEVLGAFTQARGNDPGDVARLGLVRLDDLLRADRNGEALALLETLEAGPPSLTTSRWGASLVQYRYLILDRLGRGAELGPIRLDRNPLGSDTDDKESWAWFVWRFARARGDWGVAREAAADADHWVRVQGRESLPVGVAEALAQLGSVEEASVILDSSLVRFDRVHPAARPHLVAARALLVLGREAEARRHGVLAFQQAWADGAPSHDVTEVRRAGELLDELGWSRPSLPSRQPDPRLVPLGSELLAWLDELRATPEPDPGTDSEEVFDDDADR